MMEYRNLMIHIDHQTLYRDPDYYCAHPHAISLENGDWLVVATRAPRRNIVLHPPQDPTYQNILFRSQDGGLSWSEPKVIPDDSWHGVECAGLTQLNDGRVMLNQWRFKWIECKPSDRGAVDFGPDQIVQSLQESIEFDLNCKTAGVTADMFPWSRSSGETWVHFSKDNGQSFDQSIHIDTAPFSGGYNMRGSVQFPDGEIFLPLCDVPNYKQVFVVRSDDGGGTWSSPELIAEGHDHEYEEPVALILSSGRILVALRDNVSRILHMVWSDDRGKTWNKPRKSGIEEYPAQLFELANGTLACLAGRRKPPYGIRLILSQDQGQIWDTHVPIIIRDDMPNKNLGYPTGIITKEQNMTAIYYGEDSEGVTGIEFSKFRLDVGKNVASEV